MKGGQQGYGGEEKQYGTSVLCFSSLEFLLLVMPGEEMLKIFKRKPVN